jgi:hypothetical protein
VLNYPEMAGRPFFFLRKPPATGYDAAGLEWTKKPLPGHCSTCYKRRGSLADSFMFLSQVDGAEERLFPGYAKFESSLDGRVMAGRKSLRDALERQKIRALEGYVSEGQAWLANAVSTAALTDPAEGVTVEVEAALLEGDHLAAVKLALKTKRLPLTPDDLVAREELRDAIKEYDREAIMEIPGRLALAQPPLTVVRKQPAG